MERKDWIDRIKKKTENVTVPDSLAPDNVKRILEGKRPKKRVTIYKGLAAAACFFLCILSIYVWQSGSLYNNSNMSGSKSDHSYSESKFSESQEGEGGDSSTNGGVSGEGGSENPFAPSSYDEVKEALLANITNQDSIIQEDKLRDGGVEKGIGGETNESDYMLGNEGVPTISSNGNDTNGNAENNENQMGEEEPQSEYSKTNTQVQGIDEADIVKTDGKYLYTVKNLRKTKIIVTEVKDGIMKKVSELDVTKHIGSKEKDENQMADAGIEEMYLDGDRLIVICYVLESSSANYSTLNLVFDVTDKENPVLVNYLSQDGDYETSRKSDNFIYTFSCYGAYGVNKNSEKEEFIPQCDGETLSLDDLVLPRQSNNNSFLVVTAFDITNPTEFTSKKSILAASDVYYVSKDNIYATSSLYQYEEDASTNQTQIIKIPFGGGKLKKPASATVDGKLNNSFSMDEYKGYLRMVTHVEPLVKDFLNGEPRMVEEDLEKSRKEKSSYNAVFILDANLNITGEIRDLAPDEDVYSARFMGDTGYFVTYRKMDPLFAVDLGNPKKPKVLGQLKIPGFSNYLHFYSEDLLLGIGMEFSKNGEQFKGLKLSMFDVANPSDVEERDKEVLKQYMDSTALYNHKTVLVDAKKNLLGFMAISNNREENHYLLYAYDHGFVKKAVYKLDNFGGGFYDVSGIYIGDYIYIYVLGGGINSYSLKTNELVDTLYF